MEHVVLFKMINDCWKLMMLVSDAFFPSIYSLPVVHSNSDVMLTDPKSLGITVYCLATCIQAYSSANELYHMEEKCGKEDHLIYIKYWTLVCLIPILSVLLCKTSKSLKAVHYRDFSLNVYGVFLRIILTNYFNQLFSMWFLVDV